MKSGRESYLVWQEDKPNLLMVSQSRKAKTTWGARSWTSRAACPRASNWTQKTRQTAASSPTNAFTHGMMLVLRARQPFSRTYYFYRLGREAHPKGVSMVLLFPKSGHLLLTAGMDGKVKVCA